MIIETGMVGKTIVKVEIVHPEIRLWINEFEYIRIVGGSSSGIEFTEISLMAVQVDGDRVMLEKEIST